MSNTYVAGDDLALMYDRHVGRYASSLAERTCDVLDVQTGSTAVAIACATGHLPAALAERLGAGAVVAIEPDAVLAEAARHRVRGLAVVTGPLDKLPWKASQMNMAICQDRLDQVENPAGLVTEMRRITAKGGTVAATVWDYAESMTLLRSFWMAAIQIDPIRAMVAGQGAVAEHMTADAIAELWRSARLNDVDVETITISAAYLDGDELWAPFTSPVTPSGAYICSLDADLQERIRVEFMRRLGNPLRPFSLKAGAFLVRGTV